MKALSAVGASLPLVLALTLGGCAPAARCQLDSDCFKGEACGADGFCEREGTPIDLGAADVGGQRDADGGADAATQDVAPRDTATSDTPAPDAQQQDADSALPDMSSPDTPQTECVVDRFAVCVDDEDPENNSFPGVSFDNRTKGCPNSDFVPMDESIVGVICPLEPADIYSVTLGECRDVGFVVEGVLRVSQDCDPSLVGFDVGGVGGTCAEPGDRVRCTTDADGTRRIAVLWPADPSVPQIGSMRFYIDSGDRDDVRFDYEFQMIVRQ